MPDTKSAGWTQVEKKFADSKYNFIELLRRPSVVYDTLSEVASLARPESGVSRSARPRKPDEVVMIAATKTEITRADILDRLDAMIADDKPVAANRCLTLLQTMFRWCVERELLAVSPAAGIRKPTIERSRERVLRNAYDWEAERM